MRPTIAVINLSDLKYNYLKIRSKTRTKIMAVVKADAYGHGVEKVVHSLNSLGKYKPDYFAVAISDEAEQVRKLKISQPILVFEPFSSEEAGNVFKYNLIATVFNQYHLSTLLNAKSISKSKKPVHVHVKIDTGMNRLGVKFDKAYEFVKKLSSNSNFIIDGIYTHFATSDEKDKKFAYLQLERFNNLIEKLKSSKINYGLAHAANSGAILDMPEAYFDMVRPGISLYGYYPSLETSESIPLRPVLSLLSKVSSVKQIEKGESVSYGRKFIAKHKTNIITVPLGYADGYNRNLTNKSKAIINSKVFNQVGRITMDRIMFEIKNENIKVGDKVILLGKSRKHKITAWDWGKILDTIPYEITCAISKRVPRVYKD